MMHLDDERYRQLLANPPGVPASLRAHLGTDCPACADYLASLPCADRLDGAVDALLLSGTRAASAPPGELEVLLACLPRRKRLAPKLLAIAASIAAVALASAALLRAHVDPDQGLKGAATLTLSTSFAVALPGGAAIPGVAGASYPAQAAVSVRLDLSRPAQVSLVRTDARGAEVLLLNQPLPAGLQDLAQGDQLVGVPLAGHEGAQRLTVVASERPLRRDELEAAAANEPVPGAVVSAFVLRAQSAR